MADPQDARRKFATKFAAALRKRGLQDELHYDDPSFTLRSDGGTTFFLHNAFNEWSAASFWRRGKVLAHFASAFSRPPAMPELFDDVKPDLLPRIRDRYYYDLVELTMDAPIRSTLSPVALNDELWLELVHDQPASSTSVSAEKLAKWGITAEDAMRTARHNLRLRSAEGFEETAPGFYESPWHDTYDAARLILTELIARLEVKGHPVAMLPHRDWLFICGSEDDDGLQHMAERARPLLENDRRITGQAFQLRDDRWTPFEPAANRPSRDPLRLLARLTDAMNYQGQKESLEANGEQRFVASYLLRTTLEGRNPNSTCTWTRDVITLLPTTDSITLVSDSATPDTILTIPWSRAQSILAHHLKPTALRPERHLVDTFPTDAELAALTAE